MFSAVGRISCLGLVLYSVKDFITIIYPLLKEKSARVARQTEKTENRNPKPDNWPVPELCSLLQGPPRPRGEGEPFLALNQARQSLSVSSAARAGVRNA